MLLLLTQIIKSFLSDTKHFNIRIGWLGVPPVINEVTFDGKTDWLGQY